MVKTKKNQFIARVLVALITVIMVLSGFAGFMAADSHAESIEYSLGKPATGGTLEHQRIWGNTCYDTALAVADKLYEKKGAFKNVIVAYGGNYPDALSAGYLSAVNENAPILLIKDGKENTIFNYIKSHMVKDGTVFIVGGTMAVSQKFEDLVTKRGLKVKRLSGANMYGTNLAVLKNTFESGDELIVATGKSYYDAVSCSAVSKPLLLVKDKLTAGQIDWLSRSNIKKIYIVGGPLAVNKTIERDLAKYASVKRVYGANQYQTSIEVAKKFYKNPNRVTLTTALSFQDSLSGAPLARMNNAPIIVISETGWSDARNYVLDNKIASASTIGGVLAVPKHLVTWIMDKNDKTRTFEFANPYGREKFYITSTAVAWRVCPFHGWELHDGWDFAHDNSSAPIYSVSVGKVVFAGGMPGLGSNVVIIQTDDLYIIYAHMRKKTVKKGDIVWKGRQIGLQGSEGNSTGPHLHLEFRRKDVRGYTTACLQNIEPMLKKYAYNYKEARKDFKRIVR